MIVAVVLRSMCLVIWEEGGFDSMVCFPLPIFLEGWNKQVLSISHEYLMVILCWLCHSGSREGVYVCASYASSRGHISVIR